MHPPKENNYYGDPLTGENCNQITTGIKLPRYLEEIDDYAFSHCIALEEVVMPDSVTTIDTCAFGYCIRLKEIHFSSSLRTVSTAAFCNSLLGMREMVFPDGIESIGGSAFANIATVNMSFKIPSRLERVVIPNSIKNIGDYAFQGNESLKEIEIPTDNIEGFGITVFSDTAWYENQPDGLIYIDKVLYRYKGEMPENYKLTVNTDVLGIAGAAFENQENLKEAWIADGVKFLGVGIFGDSELISVRLPTDLTCIPYSTFGGTHIREIEIPESVTEIGYGALRCTSMKWGKVILHSKCKIDYEAFSFKPIIVYQSVEYTYSAKRPTVEGNYWYIDENGYFAIWE